MGGVHIGAAAAQQQQCGLRPCNSCNCFLCDPVVKNCLRPKAEVQQGGIARTPSELAISCQCSWQRGCSQPQLRVCC